MENAWLAAALQPTGCAYTYQGILHPNAEVPAAAETAE